MIEKVSHVQFGDYKCDNCRFSIYEEEILADDETTAVEDWMAAQGHSTREQNITFKQRLKNAYIEYKWGMAFYNFPWNPKVMASWAIVTVTFALIVRYVV